MAAADAVAQAIVEYDSGLALDVLRLIVQELGGSREGDAQRLLAYLSRGDAVDDPQKTTMEWKEGFAKQERLRGLGLALGERLT